MSDTRRQGGWEPSTVNFDESPSEPESTSDLIQRLRTCGPEERKFAAIELARTGTDEAVAELKRMIEARRRRGLRWYDINDQLIGVEALSETNSPRALSYLREIYASQDKTLESREHNDGLSLREIGKKVEVFYPNAKRELRRRLRYTVEVTHPHEIECGYAVLREGEDIRAVRYKDQRTHDVLTSSIQKLESSLGK